MTVLATAHNSGPAHRRSKRLPLRVPIQVYGRTPDNQPFRGRTRTLSVNAFGGYIAMASPVVPGQSILLVHSFTQEERECRVVNVAQTRRGMYRVGVEFVRAGDNFWHLFHPLQTSPTSSRDA
jgi:c-di-GMP-binding flagellar brake protein YcgR